MALTRALQITSLLRLFGDANIFSLIANGFCTIGMIMMNNETERQKCCRHYKPLYERVDLDEERLPSEPVPICDEQIEFCQCCANCDGQDYKIKLKPFWHGNLLGIIPWIYMVILASERVVTVGQVCIFVITLLGFLFTQIEVYKEIRRHLGGVRLQSYERTEGNYMLISFLMNTAYCYVSIFTL